MLKYSKAVRNNSKIIEAKIKMTKVTKFDLHINECRNGKVSTEIQTWLSDCELSKSLRVSLGNAQKRLVKRRGNHHVKLKFTDVGVI
jgi:hypothetical protein